MGDCRYDTGPLGRRNRFRPVLRHETTGRGTNSGGRLAGEAIRGGIQAAAMTAAGKQARRRKTIKQKIVHGIQENGMNYRKTISSMIVRPAKREAGMGDWETIGRLIVRLVRREAGAGRGTSRGNSYIRWGCEQTFPNRSYAYRGRAIPMCYYDIDDTGFYDEFGNPIDPSQMDECKAN